jgi:hypothetical protein
MGYSFAFELKVDTKLTGRQRLFLLELALAGGLALVLRYRPEDGSVLATVFKETCAQDRLFTSLTAVLDYFLPRVPLAWAEW